MIFIEKPQNFKRIILRTVPPAKTKRDRGGKMCKRRETSWEEY